MDSREALVALNLIEGVGSVRTRSLLEHFGEAPAILSASKSQLLHVRNIGEETAEAIAGWEKSIDLAGEMKRIADFGCRGLVTQALWIRHAIRRCHGSRRYETAPSCRDPIFPGGYEPTYSRPIGPPVRCRVTATSLTMRASTDKCSRLPSNVMAR